MNQAKENSDLQRFLNDLRYLMFQHGVKVGGCENRQGQLVWGFIKGLESITLQDINYAEINRFNELLRASKTKSRSLDGATFS